ncbi:hypothetical protein PR001_g30253 [Phytophthora rubi]|uniref:Uncharacterized protein n=1 Tax=Phytophthora rubi TaxID=129364 RepID=A0A6A3GVA3_9STRA|nr:hypothetical protein PR001_g30253 [Phytophthora rubi]
MTQQSGVRTQAWQPADGKRQAVSASVAKLVMASALAHSKHCLFFLKKQLCSFD